jgi:hypothetical protein
MRVIRQVHPYSDTDVLLLRVWKKRVYLEGWRVQLQVGRRAWLVMPKDTASPAGPRTKQRVS